MVGCFLSPSIFCWIRYGKNIGSTPLSFFKPMQFKSPKIALLYFCVFWKWREVPDNDAKAFFRLVNIFNIPYSESPNRCEKKILDIYGPEVQYPFGQYLAIQWVDLSWRPRFSPRPLFSFSFINLNCSVGKRKAPHNNQETVQHLVLEICGCQKCSFTSNPDISIYIHVFFCY